MNKKIFNFYYFLIIAVVLHLLLFINFNKNLNHTIPNVPVIPKNIKVKVNSIKPSSNADSSACEFEKPQASSKIKEEKKVEKPEPKIEKIKKIEEKKVIPKKNEKPKKKRKEEISKKIPVKQIENINQIKENSTNKTENVVNSSTSNINENNFIADIDGVTTALSPDGITFDIIKQIEPNYPIQATRINYKARVVVKVKFLVGLDGSIEKIEILQSHKKFGFDKEVISAIKQWRFKPIYYKGKNIKVYFTKEFIFDRKK